jgi:hypothetical protein
MAITFNSAATSNRDWVTQFQFNDADTGSLIDFTGASIVMAVEDQDGCQVIYASTGNGMISIISTGIIQLSVPWASMNLCAGAYNMGGYYTLSGGKIDLFEGTLSLRKGIPAS